ncbi:PREDICTED: intercellular adhesion molecule 2 [Elephantulus edwardii]|uniref:intercellular adhesion molecule 2 n=1 Tax=Elephantulus edwardii TaxID=28737 RepID=UPI0003F0A62F|nr:PREDICTED: intercellular adhesion molecule 2 [Elephantulus edwardii]
MSFFGCWCLTVSLLALLCCPGSLVKAFEVNMWPEQLLVEPRGSLEINCSTSCPQPDTGGLETTLKKTLLDQQPQWKRYLVSNISQETVLHCHFTCAGAQKSKDVGVTVFYPPNQVTLTLQPTWVAMGKSFTLECRVPNVAPLENLTLTLFRDREILGTQTFQNATSDPQEAVVTLSVTARREDSNHNFSCQAELDLHSLGGTIIQKTSEPQALQIYEPIQGNQMVIIVSVISVLLFFFVMAVLFCFVFGQHWHQKRTGAYGVRAAWRRLSRTNRA